MIPAITCHCKITFPLDSSSWLLIQRRRARRPNPLCFCNKSDCGAVLRLKKKEEKGNWLDNNEFHNLITARSWLNRPWAIVLPGMLASTYHDIMPMPVLCNMRLKRLCVYRRPSATYHIHRAHINSNILRACECFSADKRLSFSNGRGRVLVWLPLPTLPNMYKILFVAGLRHGMERAKYAIHDGSGNTPNYNRSFLNCQIKIARIRQ